MIDPQTTAKRQIQAPEIEGLTPTLKQMLRDARTRILTLDKTAAALSRHPEEFSLARKIHIIIEQARHIVRMMRNEPDRIRAARRFFVVYLPGLEHILTAYLAQQPPASRNAQRKNLMKLLETDETAFSENAWQLANGRKDNFKRRWTCCARNSMSTTKTQMTDSRLLNDLSLENPPQDTLDDQRIGELVGQLDMYDATSILNFGSNAQKRLTDITDDMLEDVKTKDSGEAGQLLSQMVLILKVFQAEERKLREKPDLWKRLLGKTRQPLQGFLQRFADVGDQIDRISNALESRKQQLLVDVGALDRLYEATLEYYRDLRDLRHHIAAAEQVIERAEVHSLPRLKTRAEKEDSMESAQFLRDFQSRCDALERRLHDLELTRQVTMQALPSIRMIQENDKSLVGKINTTLINSLPLWRQQLTRSIAIHRSSKTAQAMKDGADLTNALLRKNAETPCKRRTVKAAGKSNAVFLTSRRWRRPTGC